MPERSNGNSSEHQAAIKKRLSGLLANEIFKHHQVLLGHYRNVFEGQSSIRVLEAIQDRISATLESYYSAANVAFRGEIEKDIGANLHPAVHQLAATSFGFWVINRRLFQAARIASTARKLSERAFALASERIAQDPEDNSTPKEVFLAGFTLAKNRLRAHAKMVGTTEVQAAAEATKIQQAILSSGFFPNELPPREVEQIVPIEGIIPIRKKWLTERDEIVRNRHAATEGQVRNASDLFDVGGQALLHPGDTSHGATLDNIIRCRCSAFFERIAR